MATAAAAGATSAVAAPDAKLGVYSWKFETRDYSAPKTNACGRFLYDTLCDNEDAIYAKTAYDASRDLKVMDGALWYRVAATYYLQSTPCGAYEVYKPSADARLPLNSIYAVEEHGGALCVKSTDGIVEIHDLESPSACRAGLIRMLWGKPTLKADIAVGVTMKARRD